MPEEVRLFIDGRRWRSWSSVEITRTLDSFDTASFSAPFEPERPEFRAAFKPFQYKPLSIEVGDSGEVFNGVQMNVDPSTTPATGTVNVSAYTRAAIIGDVPARPDVYPLELNGLTIDQIARTLCEPYGIEVVYDTSPRNPFRRVAIDVTAKIGGFLIDLAKQRGLLLSNTPDGQLRIFDYSDTASSGRREAARLAEGEAPLISVVPTFNPQAYYSEITGFAKTRAGSIGSTYTEINGRLQGVLRPLTFKLEDTDPPGVPEATAGKLGRMFGNCFSAAIEVPTWRDPSGALWEPGDLVNLTAPGAMIYTATAFTIRNVTLSQTAEAEGATLDLVLPGSFSDIIPESLPWD